MKYYKIAICIFLFSVSQVMASDCDDKIRAYNDAVESLTGALQRYSRCLSDSAGKDDCSSEFRKLKSSQSEFESAVSSLSFSVADNCEVE